MSVNLLPISSKSKICSGELIHPPGKLLCNVNYKGHLCHHSFLIVDVKQPNLLGRNILRVIKIDWPDYICKSRIYNVNNTNLLDGILEKNSEVFPSRQILVPRPSQGRPPPTSPGCPLKILFDRHGDVPI